MSKRRDPEVGRNQLELPLHSVEVTVARIDVASFQRTSNIVSFPHRDALSSSERRALDQVLSFASSLSRRLD